VLVNWWDEGGGARRNSVSTTACHARAVPGTETQQKSSTLAYPGWFAEFLADCAIRKPSPHTAKAYRQHFEAIATLVAGAADGVLNLRATELNKDNLRAAFAVYAETHSSASIRRCWSTRNTLCTYLFTAELLGANPMPVIGRPKVPKSLPKSYRTATVTELVAAIDADQGSARRNDWPERDRAIVFTSLLAGLRAASVAGVSWIIAIMYQLWNMLTINMFGRSQAFAKRHRAHRNSLHPSWAACLACPTETTVTRASATTACRQKVLGSSLLRRYEATR